MIRTLKDINWNQVYCFHEVARRLSMKKASEVLGVSVPTISEQVKRLEKLLGVVLFVRQARRVDLTKEGRALYHCTKEMFEAGVRLLDTVAHDAIGGYSVRVGIQESVSASVPLRFVERYWDVFTQYGTVNTLRASTADEVFDRIDNGSVDWALTLEKPRNRRLNFLEVGHFELAFCCSTHLYNKFLDPKDILRSIPLARSSWDTSLNELVDDHLRVHEIFPEEIIESDHLEFCLGLAQRGRCVTVLARSTSEILESINEIQLFTLGKPIKMKLYAVWLQANERMISIKKLRELVSKQDVSMSIPSDDPDFQLRVNQVPAKLLKSEDDSDQ